MVDWIASINPMSDGTICEVTRFVDVSYRLIYGKAGLTPSETGHEYTPMLKVVLHTEAVAMFKLRFT